MKWNLDVLKWWHLRSENLQPTFSFSGHASFWHKPIETPLLKKISYNCEVLIHHLTSILFSILAQPSTPQMWAIATSVWADQLLTVPPSGNKHQIVFQDVSRFAHIWNHHYKLNPKIDHSSRSRDNRYEPNNSNMWQNLHRELRWNCHTFISLSLPRE